MDIINFVDFQNAGTRFVFNGAITWIISQMARAIESKKDHLLRIRAGAVVANEPKMIWVKALSRVFSSTAELKQVNKFNLMLENVLANKSDHFIMDINQVLQDHNLYSLQNNLNEYGKKRFWSEIDKQIEKFDKHRISLKPQHQVFTDSTSASCGDHDHPLQEQSGDKQDACTTGLIRMAQIPHRYDRFEDSRNPRPWNRHNSNNRHRHFCRDRIRNTGPSSPRTDGCYT